MPTQQQSLAHSIRALGGTWHTRRAVAALRDAGHDWVDQRAAEKRARQILRELAADGLIVRVEPKRATYTVTRK